MEQERADLRRERGVRKLEDAAVAPERIGETGPAGEQADRDPRERDVGRAERGGIRVRGGARRTADRRRARRRRRPTPIGRGAAGASSSHPHGRAGA